MARSSRDVIEQAYRVIYKNGIMDAQLTKDDDKIINNALEEIRMWQGLLPYEETLGQEQVVMNREMNKDAAAQDPTTLVRWFKSIGMKPLGIWNTDWELIFALHRDFINSATKISQAEAKERWYEKPAEEPKQETVEEKKVEEKSVLATTGDDASNEASHIQNNLTKLQEVEQMADLNSTIGSMMNNGVGNSVADAQQMAQNFGGAGNMNFGANTNLSAGATAELSADEKALAAKAAAMQKSKRLAWNNEHKILYLVMGNYALRKRVKPGVTTGRVKDAASQLDKILTAVWKEDGRPANMVDGKVDGVVAVPGCVSRIGESENYTKVINALVEAKNGGNDVLDVNLNGKPGQFKGVVVQTPEGVESWTMTTAKEKINYNGQAKLQIQGITDGPQLQIKIITAKQVAAKKDKKDGTVTVNDVTQIQIPNKEKLVNTETCDIVDPAHVKVFNEIDPDVSKAAVNDKYNASSVIGFRYERKPDIDSKDQKTKKISRKIQLKVEMLAVIPSTDPNMAPFSPKSAVGQAVVPLTDKQEEEAIAAMWSRMFELGLQTGDTEVDAMRAEAVSQKAQANAQEAQNAIGAGM